MAVVSLFCVCIDNVTLLYCNITYVLDKSSYLAPILPAVGLDAAAHIDSPGMDLLDSLRHILRRKTAGQQHRPLLRYGTSHAPVMCHTRTAPFGCRRVEQNAPGYFLICSQLAHVCHVL